MGTINTSMQAVQKAQIDLGEVENLPPLGQDMVHLHCPIHVAVVMYHFKCMFSGERPEH